MTEPFRGTDDQVRENIESHNWEMAADQLTVCAWCGTTGTDIAAVHPCPGPTEGTT